jgi:hypothetical protein
MHAGSFNAHQRLVGVWGSVTGATVSDCKPAAALGMMFDCHHFVVSGTSVLCGTPHCVLLLLMV